MISAARHISPPARHVFTCVRERAEDPRPWLLEILHNELNCTVSTAQTWIVCFRLVRTRWQGRPNELEVVSVSLGNG